MLLIELLSTAHNELQEMFDPGFKPGQENHWDKDQNSHSTHYQFVTGGKSYELTLSNLSGVGAAIQEVEFALIDNETHAPRWDIVSRPDAQAAPVKTSSSNQLWELVAYGLRDAALDPSLQGFFFTAKEPSRRKLYNVLAQVIVKETGWQYRPDLAVRLTDTREKSYLVVNQKFASILKYMLDDGDIT